MENASKALIIAGAVLLSIILISLGIYVVNKGRDVVSQDQLSDTQKQAFNQKFLQYEGKIKGSQVRALYAEVQVSNASQDNIDAGRIITITPANSNAIVNTQTYTVKITAYSNGCVKTISVN